MKAPIHGQRNNSMRILCFIFCSCAVIVVFLYAASPVDIRYNQPFNRRLVPITSDSLSAIDLRANGFYIAGNTEKNIYLVSPKDILDVLITDTKLLSIQHRSIALMYPITLKSPFLEIDSPWFFIKDGTIPVVIRGETSTWKTIDLFDSIPPFTQGISLSSSSFAVHSVVGTTSQDLKNVVCKIGMDSASIKVSPVSIGSASKNYYAYDGQLIYNQDQDLVIYTCAYSSSFTVMDPDLELIYQGHTLDTINYPHIKRSEVSQGVYALASPSAIVNKGSFTSGDLLFVNSHTMGIGENRKQLEESSVIDTYNVFNGKYQFSYYIPDYKKYKMTDFRIIKHSLFGIFGPYLVRYDLKNHVVYKELADQ